MPNPEIIDDNVPNTLTDYDKIRYDKRLSRFGDIKLLYMEILGLCKRTGYCWASNYYFAEKFGVTTRTIQDWLVKLEEYGYLFRNYSYHADGKAVKDRKIYPGSRERYDNRGVKPAVHRGVNSSSYRGVKPTSPTDNNKNTVPSSTSSEGRNRGTRVSSEFRPKEDSIKNYVEKYKNLDIEHELECFIDYWLGVAGSRGVKADWDATFRNHLRRENKFVEERKLKEEKNGKPNRQGATSRLFDKIQVEGEGGPD